MLADLAQVLHLARGTALQVQAARAQARTFVFPAGLPTGLPACARAGAVQGVHQPQVDVFAGKRVARIAVKGLQHAGGQCGFVLGAFHAEMFSPAADCHPQGTLDLFQIFVKHAAQVGQALVVHRLQVEFERAHRAPRKV